MIFREQILHTLFEKILFFIFFFATFSVAQENSECYSCHEDRTLKGIRKGKTISVFVDEKKLSSSVHAEVQCVTCHTDLEGKEIPHDEALKPAQCGTCHDAEQSLYNECMHGKAEARGDPLAPRCTDCHGSHDIVPIKNPQSKVSPIRIPFVCGKCHHEGSKVSLQHDIPQERILENYSESMHAEGLLKKGLVVAATCASCHTPHRILPHTDARSSISRKNIAATCTQCHTEIETVHRKIIQGELWEKESHVLPACVDCHQPHKARKVFYDLGMSNIDCLKCHAQPNIVSSKDNRSLHINSDEFVQSMHKNISCSQCHSEVIASKHRPCETITKKVECSSCHTAVGDEYKQSTHGQLRAKNDMNAPTCKECHGTHNVLGRNQKTSPIFPTNIPALCARCHREGQKAAMSYEGSEQKIIEHYQESIHGKGLLKSGLTVTATCADCHTAHRELPHTNPQSSIHQKNVAQTCGTCHYGIEEQFAQSVHSPDVTKTEKELPVCNDCHTAHTIRRTDQEGFRLMTMNTCGRCHEKIAETYFDTYHGKVSQLGYGKTAKCYDCHGAHDILPVSDVRSHLSRENVVATCQKCHEGATRQFAGYLTHATHHDPGKYPYLFWVFWGMTTLLVSVFILGGLHTIMWLPRALQMRKHQKHMHIEENAKQYQRFSRLNRMLHIAMIVSFLSLALTGLTLKFSYTQWAVILSHLFGGFESAGVIHRAAAILMIIIFVVHIVDLFERKKHDFKTWKAMLFGANTMLPTKNDLQECIGSVKWFLGMGERPKYGRWTYLEKFDYFAVFWGVFIIGSTGMMLWFPEFFTQFFPGWFLNVATIIHSDEALLATGFIFTVHFFNTHLRPEKFPMDIVVFTGRVSVEEFQHDKPKEYEALVANGELEKFLVEPYPPIVIKAIRIFGWCAVTIGFSIIIWIIYAMLFAYR